MYCLDAAPDDDAAGASGPNPEGFFPELADSVSSNFMNMDAFDILGAKDYFDISTPIKNNC